MIILDNHRRSTACYHQHGSALSYGFVIQVDAYDGVAAQGCGTVGHLSEGWPSMVGVVLKIIIFSFLFMLLSILIID